MNPIIQFVNGKYSLLNCTQEYLYYSQPAVSTLKVVSLLLFVIVGIILHLIIFISYTNRDIVYAPDHYLILSFTFLIAGVTYIVAVIPFTVINSLNYHNSLLVTKATSFVIANFCIDTQIVLLGFFGYSRIITFLRLTTGRILLQRKQTVNIVSLCLLISLSISCCRVTFIRFQAVCLSENHLYSTLIFKSRPMVIVNLCSMSVICLIISPLIICHIIVFIYDNYSSKQRESLSYLPTKRVIIVTDKMKDLTSIVLYIALFIIYISIYIIFILLLLFYDDFDVLKHNKSYEVIGVIYAFFAISTPTTFILCQAPLRNAILLNFMSLVSRVHISRDINELNTSDATISSNSEINDYLTLGKANNVENEEDIEVKFKIRKTPSNLSMRLSSIPNIDRVSPFRMPDSDMPNMNRRTSVKRLEVLLPIGGGNIPQQLSVSRKF